MHLFSAWNLNVKIFRLEMQVQEILPISYLVRISLITRLLCFDHRELLKCNITVTQVSKPSWHHYNPTTLWGSDKETQALMAAGDRATDKIFPSPSQDVIWGCKSPLPGDVVFLVNYKQTVQDTKIWKSKMHTDVYHSIITVSKITGTILISWIKNKIHDVRSPKQMVMQEFKMLMKHF